MKCTTHENDLLRQLLRSAAEAAGTGPGSAAGLACSPPAQYLLLPPGCGQHGAGPAAAAAACCSPVKLFSVSSGSAAAAAADSPSLPALAPAASPADRPPRAPSQSLPPSPFESPRKRERAPSPSKPHTPARTALRSPHAAAGRSRLSFAGLPAAAAPADAASKAALLEQLGRGGAPLAHGVALALLHGLQRQQEGEMCGEAPAAGGADAVTEEEACYVAALALMHAQARAWLLTSSLCFSLFSRSVLLAVSACSTPSAPWLAGPNAGLAQPLPHWAVGRRCTRVCAPRPPPLTRLLPPRPAPCRRAT